MGIYGDAPFWPGGLHLARAIRLTWRLMERVRGVTKGWAGMRGMTAFFQASTHEAHVLSLLPGQHAAKACFCQRVAALPGLQPPANWRA